MDKLKNHSSLIIRLGLASVFFANAYVAWFAPDEFKDVLAHSFLSGALPLGVDSLIKLIGVSDALVAALLLLGMWRRLVSAYAALWILGVIVVSQPSEISDIFEHIGFLAMALYLWVDSVAIRK